MNSSMMSGMTIKENEVPKSQNFTASKILSNSLIFDVIASRLLAVFCVTLFPHKKLSSTEYLSLQNKILSLFGLGIFPAHHGNQRETIFYSLCGFLNKVERILLSD